VADVVVALRHACDCHMTVAVRGAGHNYAPTFLRKGGMLRDVSTLKAIRVDTHTGDA
jgi:FAD/FMN-containing dehydrogenase